MDEKTYNETLALSGISRLAFGDINDALSLFLSKDDALASNSFKDLDLFCISKVTLNEKGDVEIVFYDRQKALSILLDYALNKNSEKQKDSFYDALKASAQSLSKLSSGSHDI